MLFIIFPGYPEITRTGNTIAIRAPICRFPETNPGPMTRDLPLGPLAAGTYSVELYVTDICTSIGPPPATVWSGVFLVRGQPIEIPFLGAVGLGLLGLVLAAAAGRDYRSARR